MTTALMKNVILATLLLIVILLVATRIQYPKPGLRISETTMPAPAPLLDPRNNRGLDTILSVQEQLNLFFPLIESPIFSGFDNANLTFNRRNIIPVSLVEGRFCDELNFCGRKMQNAFGNRLLVAPVGKIEFHDKNVTGYITLEEYDHLQFKIYLTILNLKYEKEDRILLGRYNEYDWFHSKEKGHDKKRFNYRILNKNCFSVDSNGVIASQKLWPLGYEEIMRDTLGGKYDIYWRVEVGNQTFKINQEGKIERSSSATITADIAKFSFANNKWRLEYPIKRLPNQLADYASEIGKAQPEY